MKKVMGSLILVGVLCGISVSPLMAENNFGIGAGAYYNKMLGDLDRDNFRFDEDYVSYLFSLKYQFLGILAVEGILDYYPGSGDLDYTLKPMGTAVLGNFINVGVGINKSYVKYELEDEGKKSGWSDLTYHFKLGLQIPLGDTLWINADAYYFLDELKDIEDFDKDYITFGARVHFRL